MSQDWRGILVSYNGQSDRCTCILASTDTIQTHYRKVILAIRLAAVCSSDICRHICIFICVESCDSFHNLRAYIHVGLLLQFSSFFQFSLFSWGRDVVILANDVIGHEELKRQNIYAVSTNNFQNFQRSARERGSKAFFRPRRTISGIILAGFNVSRMRFEMASRRDLFR